jgi:hypothetical protein
MDVRVLAIVGSVARGEARLDSDVDVVLVVADPGRYLQHTSWVSDLGEAGKVALEAYGKVTSVRVLYAGGLEVEFAIAAADWVSAPFDPGTVEVARRGMMVLLDRDGHARALEAFVSGNAESQPALSEAAADRFQQ